MLKFIRKYQLIILAVGGSLLMVVFLFQPIIGKISPDPRKAAEAKLADGTTFNGFDFQQASLDIAILKRVFPRAFYPIDQGGLGLEPGSEEKSELHWLLLSKQAKDAGLVGDAGEGRTWIPTIAQREATAVVQQQLQQGALDFSNAQQALIELTAQVETALTRNVALATGMARGMTEDDVYRTMATARGIERLYRVFASIPAYSDLGAMHAAKDRFDTVAVDAAVIKGDLFADSIAIPSESELQAFFDQYAASAPSDNDYFIGYTQPARAKLGWITLNKAEIEASIEIDRVELNKIWRTDRNLPEGTRKYPGDFAGERRNIEAAYREQRAFDIMFEADKIIRSQVLQSTRGLSKEGDFYTLPDDWNSTRPTLESIAQAVVTGLKEQLKVDFPLPTVEIQTDRWLNSRQLSTIPGFGAAGYRIGQRQLPTYLIPQATDSNDPAALLTIQSQIPIVDPAAEDQDGNRYYAVVYELKAAGPSESIDDAGRDQVLKDYRTVKGYEMLAAAADQLKEEATQANDLAPAITTALAMGADDAQRPGVARNILVSKQSVVRGRLASNVEPQLNTPAFRDAVTQAASSLDQLTPPDQIDQSPIIIAAPIPGAKSLALAKVIAPRPLTSDQFKAQIGGILTNESQNQIRDAITATETSPFTLDTLSERYGYTRIKKRKDEVEAQPETQADPESDADPASDSASDSDSVDTTDTPAED